ncbi:ferritin-like domain-containing protein [Acuticoccus sp.]|uniref:ferritin-like domain-containing protein n=1 Tax=Acuticoccus sp. TaxID=1904378 RepID=UPI003B515737
MSEPDTPVQRAVIVTENEGARTIDLDAGRRAFLRSVGVGAVGATALAGGIGGSVRTARAQDGVINDIAILNFALNLEYLEAEFYLRAAFGRGLSNDDIDGEGELGPVTGGAQVSFDTKDIRLYAEEIAMDEEAHVKFLRAATGDQAIARPAINLQRSFNQASRAAGLGNNFNPFTNEVNFLLAAFIFEDVGVTAYKGAAPLIEDPAILSAAAGLLGTEAYHAGLVRTTMRGLGLLVEANRISDARDSLDGPSNRDGGIGTRNRSNIVPTDDNALIYGRTPRQVLDIVYLSKRKRGGFFPQGINGALDAFSGNADDDDDDN